MSDLLDLLDNPRTVAAADRLLRNQFLAAYVEAALASERTGRCLTDRTLGAAARSLGLAPVTRKRMASERRQRAALAPDRPTSGRGLPEVFWHAGGAADPAMGPVVVLINGWSASGLMWPEAVVDPLEESSFVIRVDNRGAGYSRTAPLPASIATMADDVADVLAWYGAAPARVVGLSMGGMIAQELALRRPERVERLVLCGTRPPSPASFSAPPAVMVRLLDDPAPGESLDDLIRRTWGTVFGPGFAQREPEMVDELIDQLRRRPTPRHAILAQMRAISAWHGSHRLRRITAPTTVLHGTDDPLIPVGNGLRLAQLIPGARYVELPGVGHIVPSEAPDAVIDAVTSPNRAR